MEVEHGLNFPCFFFGFSPAGSRYSVKGGEFEESSVSGLIILARRLELSHLAMEREMGGSADLNY